MASRQLARVEAETPEAILAAHLDSWEAIVSEYIVTRRDRDNRQFKLGAIVSLTETKYGEKSINALSTEVGDATSTLYLYRDVYRTCYQFSNRLENLTWSHFAYAVQGSGKDEDCESLLIEAADNGWSAKQFKREIGLRRVAAELADEVPHLDPQMAAAISHWRELRPMIEKFAAANPQFSLYAEDFIGDVDEAIDDPWDSARAFIDRLIFGGCREVEFLAQASHWHVVTCERLCEELVMLGTHEWRSQGGKTDDARGAVRRLIVPIEEPSGDAYEAYHGDRMSIIQGEDD